MRYVEPPGNGYGQVQQVAPQPPRKTLSSPRVLLWSFGDSVCKSSALPRSHERDSGACPVPEGVTGQLDVTQMGEDHATLPSFC